MALSEIAYQYLEDLGLLWQRTEEVTLDLIREIQCRHVAKYTFNSLAVVLQQEIPLETELLFKKIVQQGRGGYCFEHNKLVYSVLSELGADVRILLAKVVYNRDIEVPRTHRITLINIAGENYLMDAGFGYFGARYPVKLELDVAQDQGDFCYRITENSKNELCYQVLRDGEFFTLYTFDLYQYTESDCLVGHFYSHKYPAAAFVNNLVVSKRLHSEYISLRNHELHHYRKGNTQITVVEHAEGLHHILTDVFALNVDVAVSEFLYNKYCTGVDE